MDARAASLRADCSPCRLTSGLGAGFLIVATFALGGPYRKADGPNAKGEARGDGAGALEGAVKRRSSRVNRLRGALPIGSTLRFASRLLFRFFLFATSILLFLPVRGDTTSVPRTSPRSNA